MTYPSRRDELEQFKTNINLCQFLASQGYLLDARSSSRCSAVMKHNNGDKLIVARSDSKCWIYFNVHGSDSGTIIDFVQRNSMSLGEVRKMLRPWLGRSPTPIRDLPNVPDDLVPSKRDMAKVLAAWMKSAPIAPTNDYLSIERSIPPAIFCHPKFVDRIRVDARRNVLFGHRNRDGICGFEVKNKSTGGRSFTGFASGGTKGLFFSSPMDCDSELILCETAIDLLSIAALRGINGLRLMSIAGQVSPLQLELIASAAKKMPGDTPVRLAMDCDSPGRQLADRIAAHLTDQCGIKADRIIPDFPQREGDDWNDVLRSRCSSPLVNPAPC